MIHVSRGAEPSALAANWRAWTDAWVESKRGGPQLSEAWAADRYGDPDVRSALARDARGKCMYCEGRIKDVSYPHVEHYRPKGRYPELTFRWDNLGLSCSVCNVNKGDIFDKDAAPVDPYSENPSDFLRPLGWYVQNHLGNERGRVTVELMDLNRGDLLESRRAALLPLLKLLDVARSSSGSLREVALKEVRRAVAADAEFSFVCSQAARDLGGL